MMQATYVVNSGHRQLHQDLELLPIPVQVMKKEILESSLGCSGDGTAHTGNSGIIE